MIYPKSKLEIINLILTETKDDPDFPWKDTPADKIIIDWFVTGRGGAGLRLTDAGMMAFDKAKIAHYDFEFIPPKAAGLQSISWAKYALTLDKKIKCPYFVGIKIVDKGKKQPYIRVYDHKIAMMMTLYGDFISYIESIK